MNNNFKTFVFIAILFQFAISQSIIVTRSIVNPLTNFDLSLLDLSGSGKGPELFRIMLLPANPPNSAQYKIRFETRIKNQNTDSRIYLGESGVFTIPSPITITSNQFFDQYGINDTLSIQKPLEIMSDQIIQELILSAGTISSGAIKFDFKLIEILHKNVVQTAGFNMDVAAIRYVKLLSPGKSITDENGKQEIYTRYPQFIWSSDLLPIKYKPGQAKFVLSIYEKINNQSLDPQKSIPIWTTDITDVNYAQYPASGVTGLDEGKTYFWQVKGILVGPTNSQIKSEVFEFKIASLSNLRTKQNNIPTEILEDLSTILGSGFGYLLEDLGELNLSGPVLLNGKPIDGEKLKEIANLIKNGELRIKKAEIK